MYFWKNLCSAECSGKPDDYLKKGMGAQSNAAHINAFSPVGLGSSLTSH